MPRPRACSLASLDSPGPARYARVVRLAAIRSLGTNPAGVARKAPDRAPIIRTIEWSLFGAFCVLTVALHLVLYRHSGSFWRDETNSIQVASAPSLLQVWSWLHLDSFPALWATVLHGWIVNGPGSSPEGLRLFGIALSLGLVAAVLVAGRTVGVGVPLLALPLISLNSNVFYFGSSLRAYGLAASLTLLCFAVFWRLIRSPTKLNVALAAFTAMLTAHCSYSNTYLLLAIGTAAAGACAARRLWARALLVLASCLPAAVSMLVYLPVIGRYRDMVLVAIVPWNRMTLPTSVAEALASGSRPLLILWIGLLAGVAALLSVRSVREWRTDAGRRHPSLALYCLLTFVLGVAAGYIFVHANGLFPYPWHFTSSIALAALLIDISLSTNPPRIPQSIAKAGLACAVVAASIAPIWSVAHLRRTNLDLVSVTLGEEAAPDDLILVSPFYLSPGFNYHYRGTSAWNTVPAIPDDAAARIAPYAPVKKLMTEENALDPTLRLIERALRSGHRLWIVGALESPSPGVVATRLPPAPASEYRWNSNAYVQAWAMQVTEYLQAHAVTTRPVPVLVQRGSRSRGESGVDSSPTVSPLENEGLVLVEGWQQARP